MFWKKFLGIKTPVLIDTKKGKRYEFSRRKKKIIIGRADECDVFTDTPQVSREHAEITNLSYHHNILYTITDKNSKHGTAIRRETAKKSIDIITVNRADRVLEDRDIILLAYHFREREGKRRAYELEFRLE